ncbi:MAG: N-acetylmuramic acid 6-phosphate etherase [Myxococcaceae bacterium]|nr:N-acetylmuramic acid 6-phosphate etherase [Myxococcaceae bacterium]MCI0669810.1 N-acetylmuramic acid 6-phosphate etherase [Myxococcaceae bacterium]
MPGSTEALASTETLHARSVDLDLRDTREVIERLHEEDRVAVEAVGRVLPALTRASELVTAALRAGGRLVYVGAGTSGRLGALDAAELPPTFGTLRSQVIAVIAGGPAALRRAVEGAEDDPAAGARAVEALRVGRADVVCGISASGTTPFVRGALRAARRRRARTLLVTCNPRGWTPAVADLAVIPDTGPELVSGSTRLKAGTATKLVLNALSTAAMVALGKVYRGRMVDVQVTNRKLAARAVRMVSDLTAQPPAAARRLLARAGGSVRLAVALHLTGAPLDETRARLARGGLRALEAQRPGLSRRRRS